MAAKSKKGQKKKSQLQGDPHEWIHQIAFWGLALLLFLPPYFRGLFFATEQEKALLFATLVFWVVFVWRWLLRDHKFSSTPLDYFALALPVVYILSSFFAVNKGLAVEEVVVNILYFLTFWSVSRIVRHDLDAESIVKIIYISAVGVALAGLATITDIIHIKDGFKGGRIFSTYQYPNALASLLGGVFFMGVYLWYRAGEQYKEALESTKKSIYMTLHRLNLFSYIFIAGNFLLMVVLLGTKSKGGLLVFVPVFIIYVLGAGAKKRFITALYLGYLGVLAVIVGYKFTSLAMDKQIVQAWGFVIGGLVLVLAGQFVYQLLEDRVFFNWGKRNYNLSFGAVAGVVLIAAAVWLSVNPGVIDKATRFSTIDTGLHRIYYMQTAREMILERPVLGWGGGGWEEAYKAFIDYRYPTKEVHSYYFQLGVETGFLGLLVIAGILGSFLYLVYKLHRRYEDNQTNRFLVWSLTASFLMIAGHALIDFDLSLSSLTMVLFSVFGIIAGLYRGEPIQESKRERKKQSSRSYIPLLAATVLVICIVIGSCSLMYSRGLMKQGVAMIRSNQAEKGIEYIEKATTYAFFKPGYHSTLSQIYNSMGKQDKALEEAKRAVELSSYSVQPRHNLVKVAIAAGQYELAARAAERTLELSPNEITAYQTYGKIFNKLGIEELKAGNKEQARDYFNRALKVPQMVKKQANSLSKRDKRMWKGPRLRITREIRLHTGQAFYWLGDFKAAEEDLKAALKNKELKGKAHMCLAMLYEKQGAQQKAKQQLNKAAKESSGIKNQYKSLIKLPVLQD